MEASVRKRGSFAKEVAATAPDTRNRITTVVPRTAVYRSALIGLVHPIRTPFRRVAMHVMKTKTVGRLFASDGRECERPLQSIIVCNLRADAIAQMILRCSSR